MSRPGGNAIPEPPAHVWQYCLILTAMDAGRWDVLWVANGLMGQRRIWDRWQLQAQKGARTASLIASDTWVAATELCERQMGA